jgi:hypothetical protein
MKVQPLEFEKPIVELEKQLDELKKHSKLSSVDLDREVRAMETKIEETKREIYEELTAWQSADCSAYRTSFALDYLNLAFRLSRTHGDRLFGMTRRCPADLRRSVNIVVQWSRIRRDETPRRTSGEISGALIPKVIERRSASCGSPKNFICPCSH